MANGTTLHNVIGIAAGAIHHLDGTGSECRTLTIVMQDDDDGPVSYFQIDCFGVTPKHVSIQKCKEITNPIPLARPNTSKRYEIV